MTTISGEASTHWSIVARQAVHAGTERKSDNISNGSRSAYLSGDLAWSIPAARKPKTTAPIRPVRGYEQHLVEESRALPDQQQADTLA
jgi:hypothetical protein